MSDREYIAALERDLKAMTLRAEVAEQRIKSLYQITCDIAANTNKAQRMLRGE